MAGEYIEFNNNSQPALNDVNINRLQQLIKQDIQGAVSGDTLPVGAIMPFGSNTIPENWLLCNGQAISRTDYQELFNTIGITYGSGDGFTTFNLPDLQGKIPVGLDENDTDFDTLGNTGGEKEHTLTINEMPSHNHQREQTGRALYWDENLTEMGGLVSGVNVQISWNRDTTNTGGSQPHNILQPYIVQNYIIKAKQSAGIVATVVDGLNSISATNALSANQGRILNDRFNYSTEEKVVGTWIDGKPIYRKVIDFGIFPNSTHKEVQHNISNLQNFVKIDGIAIRNDNNFWQAIPLTYRNADTGYNTSLTATQSKVVITCDADRSMFNGYVILEYTKTTD
jgi:microcystin-dependent protein